MGVPNILCIVHSKFGASMRGDSFFAGGQTAVKDLDMNSISIRDIAGLVLTAITMVIIQQLMLWMEN